MKGIFKQNKKLCQVVVILLSICMFGNIAVSATDEGIIPYYNNTNTTSTNFTISSSGTATVSVGYTGYSTTSGAMIETKLQKKVLGLFWKNVDNGTWVDSASSSNYRNSHSISLDSKGTYRIIVKYQIWGTGGPTDVIESTIERVYS